MQYDFGFGIRRTLRLVRVEEILRQSGVIDPVPSRPYLIAQIEEGKLEGKLTDFGYVVYEESFKQWVADYQTAA